MPFGGESTNTDPVYRSLRVLTSHRHPTGEPIQGTAIQILAALSFSISVGCASSPTISIDANGAWSRFRTYDWAQIAVQAALTPNPDVAGLSLAIAQHVGHALAERGFERDRRAPDLRIDVRLSVRRERVIVIETGAIEQLSSLHSSPSYQVQAGTKRLETYERSRLVVIATDARRRSIVWKGALEERFRGQFSPHSESMIEALLERFPPAAHTEDHSPPPDRLPEPDAPTQFARPDLRSTLGESSHDLVAPWGTSATSVTRPTHRSGSDDFRQKTPIRVWGLAWEICTNEPHPARTDFGPDSATYLEH